MHLFSVLKKLTFNIKWEESWDLKHALFFYSILLQLDEATEGEARPADEGGRGEGQAVEAEAGARSDATQAERTKAAMPRELPR